MKKIITELGNLKSIPYMLFHEEGTVNLPLVIICHGYDNDRFEGASYALKLASEGIASLCFDMAKQGERYDGFIDNITCDADFGKALFTIIEESYDDIETLMEHFSKDDRIDGDRIAISGISHGANLCFYALKKNKRLKASVPILGSPNFTDLITYSMEKESQDQFIDSKEVELLDYIKGLDPYDYLINEEIRPMLVINGEKDDDVPAKFSKEFHQKILLKSKDESSPVELFIADEHHYVSREMIAKAIEWLKNNL
jgi:dienelactone hydrolase